MDDNQERRRHYPGAENVPLSEAVREAVQAHENAEALVDEAALYDHVDVEAIDQLFADAGDVSVSAQLHLPNVTVSIWSDGGVDIRVTERPR